MKTQIKGGVVHDGKGKQFTTLQDALAHDTKCGCGINCKKGYLVLPNLNSISGDGDQFMAIYVVNGSIEIDTVANVEAILAGYCVDPDVSATSVSISGCLPATPLVATVSVGGLVTAVATGSATITFTSTDGGFTATCVITVPV